VAHLKGPRALGDLTKLGHKGWVNQDRVAALKNAHLNANLCVAPDKLRARVRRLRLQKLRERRAARPAHAGPCKGSRRAL
jgi:hypothetical protein